MSAQEDHLLRDLYGDNYKYYQDHSTASLHWLRLIGSFVPGTLLLLGLVYVGFYALDFNLLPLPELLWNWIVYIIPSQLIDLLDHDVNSSTMADSSFRSIPRTHAAKSESMRRILGFDKYGGGLMGTVAQVGRRRLSSLPSMRMGMQGEDGRPPGLGNWDNSCYQNSVLQGLASLDSLSNYLSGPKSRRDSTEQVEMEMADSLRSLIAELKNPMNNGKRIWTPATLKSMSSWQQQDAQEYFSKVLDEIDKEIIKATIARTSSQGLNSSELGSLSGHGIESGEGGPCLEAGIRNPLEGLLAQRVGCTRCGYSEGLSMIPFNCLTVPLGKAWYYDISECLDEYTKLEKIEGVECGKCTLLKIQRLLSIILERIKDTPDDNQVRASTTTRLKIVTDVLDEDDYDDKTLTQKCNLPPKNRMNTTKSRQAVIARPPQSLAIHINRSLFDEQTGELKKNYAEVRFPRTLDLGPWCLGSTGKVQDTNLEEWLLDPEQSMISGTQNPSRVRGPVYELRAVVTHYGRHENGHYICYRKHPVLHDMDEKSHEEEQWWRLSDDDVVKVSEDNVLGQGGIFMLFYDCIEPASPMSSPSPNAERASMAVNATEAVVAASVPLPDDSDDYADASDMAEQNPSTPAKEQSIATTLSERGDEGSPPEQGYLPIKPIVIPSRIQSSGMYNDEGKQQRMRSPGSMVMV